MESRFDRQEILEGFGEESVDILRQKQIAVIGAGAVATTALPLLVSCGVGNVKICDGDNISISNLHRQTLFSENDVGKNKAVIAAKRLSQLNSQTKIAIAEKYLEKAKEIEDFIQSADLCLDMTDSFASRTLISNACANVGIREIVCSATEYIAQMFLFDDSFKFSDIIPNAENEKSKHFAIFPPASHLSGIWGAGIAIKILLQMEEFKAGYMQQFDFRNNTFFKCNLNLK